MHLHIKELDRSKIKSEPLSDYLAIKDSKSDCIVFYQIGNFYETLFEDAKILSDLTGLALGSRKFSGVGEVAQCGIPISNNLNIYIKQLLANNYKICLCQEYLNNENIIKREITRTYTKGTLIDSDFLETNENNYILALFKKNNSIQLAYADISTGQFYKTSDNYKEIKLEIEKIEPKEILILENQEEYFKDLKQKYNITYLNSSFYTENINDIIENYCKYTQKDFCPKLDEIKKYSINNFLIMDETTRKNLELTRTKMHLKKRGSLFWFLNYTKTPMGARLLKKYIDEPLLNQENIKQRQSAIDELINNKKILNNLEKTLEEFCDLSRICARISNSTIFPKDLLRMALSTIKLENLKNNIQKLNSDLLKLNEEKIAKVLNLAYEIIKAIKKDAQDEITQGGIIKEDYNCDLDYLLKELKTHEQKITSYQNKEKNRLEIDKLKISYTNILGYYIEIPNSKAQRVSSEYYKKQTLSNCTRFSTEKLNTLEQKILSLKYKINKTEYELYCNLRTKAGNFVELIRDIAQEIAKIDVFCSFAKCAIVNNFTKPEFNKNKIYIENGFHPSLIKLKNEIIKNDTNIKNNSLIILTGANMSGKSTYLKYNAIICLLAQIGSFIPADYANLTIIDKLFLRQGSSDDIINNNSSFMVEMNDLKFILDNITNNSFILLDEPAKSTSEKEGGAIARAFCEYIINKYKTKMIIATHNSELTKLEAQYQSQATNLVIGNSDFFGAISDRKIRPGIINSSMAINTAELADLPNEIIKNAKEYLSK